ncbi:Sulfur carrier protein ThiS [Dissulfuribacter thermophilus]|uniref:Sulfur carrier protein ThiS n=1 Tax=Dissulfuribacter thermophilus TaxID=1156395 RepID=A0A1B9F644_9BACT|nr:sulfur carrier protein ThiS [Dissulfuribacter thermophilus]OCC15241.1 Sulfur carrier protein ThiS [Dissulfuribacter thermophilus]
MKVKINGKEQEIAEISTVKDLLDQLGLDCSRVAVELNYKILERDKFESTELSEGDVVEIVRFVGGG